MHRSLAPLAVALLALASACPDNDDGRRDSGAGAPRPEDRFGNDPVIVADFAALKRCTFEPGGRLDRGCPQVRTLVRRVETKRVKPDNRGKVVTTLVNLLESRSEQTRLAAADRLYAFHRDPRVIGALRRALTRERAPRVKATMLRQLCWNMTPAVERRAMALLGRTEPEAVRVEAADCFARHGAASPAAREALRQALARDPAEAVRGSACVALGAVADGKAVATMVAAMKRAHSDRRCGTALASVATRPAYAALTAELRRTMAARRVPPQYVSALVSLARKPYFERERVVALLAQLLADRQQGWISRERAARALGALGARDELQRVQAGYRDAREGKRSGGPETRVADEIARQLAGE